MTPIYRLIGFLSFVAFPFIAPLQGVAGTESQGSVQNCAFNIQKMSCATCPLQVKAAIGRLKGVQRVDVSLETRTATVAFDPSQTGQATIASAATEIGYPTQLRSCRK